MNKEKRADLIKEKQELEATILDRVVKVAFPIVGFISASLFHKLIVSERTGR